MYVVVYLLSVTQSACMVMHSMQQLGFHSCMRREEENTKEAASFDDLINVGN